MPVFSIGFVVYASPRRVTVSECARAVIDWPVTATWARDDGMNCGCGPDECVSRGYICAPQGDDVAVLFSVLDQDGDEFDISGATEIVFAVADERGGLVRFVKTLTDGDIVASTNGYQFRVYLTGDDTNLPVKKVNYYEARVTNSAGEHKTVSAGAYIATRTIIKDLV